ncbi:MAG: hypothetical protein GYA87_05270 [Christensenellaceae bacterium]|nr:hypothetical protein [Christensenellaceae bacterium]
MSINDVITMLSEYKVCKARCLYLEGKIQELELLIEKKKSSIIDDEVSITSVLSDMPRGTDISSPVEKLAIKVADGYLSTDVVELQREQQKLTEELEKGKTITVYVEAWICGLASKERCVIEKFYFEKLTWREIQNYLHQKYGDYLSKSTLRRIKSDALDKILTIIA